MVPGKILVVEDDQLARMILTRKLKTAGFEVFVAENGERGLDLAHRYRPDVILSDWVMPRMDGPQLCQRIKADPQLRYSYFILISARGRMGDRVGGLETGADEYLVKPCPDEELIARLQAGLRLVRLQQELIHLQEELAEKNRILERLAITDPLTGLYNRRYFLEILGAEIYRSHRYRHPLTLMMCDIDDFKRINDAYGHQAGDEVLCQMSALFRSNMRTSDMVARYGGEEFVIVLPESDLSGGMVVAERIRSEIAGHPFILPGLLSPIQVTVSFGIAEWHNSRHSSLSALIKDVDEALYRAKRSGKNRVCTASSEKMKTA